MKRFIYYCSVLYWGTMVAWGFVVVSPNNALIHHETQRHRTLATKRIVPSTARHAVVIDEASAARTAFFFWFVGASGGAGIARGAFPRMYRSARAIQELKGQGPTLGGPKLGIRPFLVGYPEDICVADLRKVVNNKLSVEQIVKKYPIEDNFLSKAGYLTFQAFQQANADANPLAVRAIFDTFAQSTDVVEADKAQARLEEFREDITRVRGALLVSKLVGYSAIAVLLFLLGLADVVAAGHAYHGWFPEWPGAESFPWTMFDTGDRGLAAIPRYWLSE